MVFVFSMNDPKLGHPTLKIKFAMVKTIQLILTIPERNVCLTEAGSRATDSCPIFSAPKFGRKTFPTLWSPKSTQKTTKSDPRRNPVSEAASFSLVSVFLGPYVI